MHPNPNPNQSPKPNGIRAPGEVLEVDGAQALHQVGVLRKHDKKVGLGQCEPPLVLDGVLSP